jgi:hypothetical protein
VKEKLPILPIGMEELHDVHEVDASKQSTEVAHARSKAHAGQSRTSEVEKKA